MKKNIFIKSFFITLLSVLIMFFAGVGITYISNKNIVSERIVVEAKLASALINHEEEYSTLNVFRNQDDCRVTVISMDGEVLYESDTSEALSNHLNREEVIAAISGTPKTVERFSNTFNCNMTYYAVKTHLENGDEVIVRLSIKSAHINEYILSSLPFLLLALILSAIVAGIFARKLSENVACRITDIADSLKSVNDGNYIPLKINMNDSEFFAVYDEINTLNSKTVEHIHKEENDREKLNAVLDNVSQGIIALSKENKIVFVNGSALSLFNGDKNVVAKEIVYLINDTKLLDKITFASGKSDNAFEYIFEDKCLLVETVVPAGDLLRDEVTKIVIISDITAQKELARQKEEFFANASHELKTPLTTMLGLTEIALSKCEDEGIKKNLSRIHKESSRLAELISDMLKLSRLETMQDDVFSVSVQMSSVANEVINELAESIRNKKITASVSGQATVLADEKRMYELMQNLITNAVHYNKVGGQIEVTLEETDKSSIIKVKDTGIGIAEENIPHLCERFYRVDKSRSKKTGGTGLGLAIVKHICALYGAEIVINSEIDVGTEFIVVFKKDK